MNNAPLHSSCSLRVSARVWVQCVACTGPSWCYRRATSQTPC